MGRKRDTQKARNGILRYLNDGPAVTFQIGRSIKLTTRQTYPILRRMEQAGLVERDGRMAGLWHLSPLPQPPQHKEERDT